MKKIKINTEFITLGQFLKIADYISSGGAAKYYLAENEVYVDEELEARRGRKLYEGMKVRMPDEVYEITHD